MFAYGRVLLNRGDHLNRCVGNMFFFLDSTFHALYYYISMFMIGLNHRFMHAR